MSTLSGIKDAAYLAQFLGKKIAIKSKIHKDLYYIYKLEAIFCYQTVEVSSQDGTKSVFSWDECENPYVMLQENVEIVLK